MKKYKYLRLSKTKKLRYSSNYLKKKLYIIFLPGFMSDIEGEKPTTFLRFAIKRRLGFLTLEYSGHGKSSGDFTKGNISEWTGDTKNLIKKIVKKNNFILIGSSMGAWIALNQFKYFKKQIKGFIGIGSAPEFLDRLMWKKFPKKIKKDIKEKAKAKDKKVVKKTFQQKELLSKKNIKKPKKLNKKQKELVDICTILEKCSIDEISKYLLDQGKRKGFPDITRRQ